MLAQREQFHQSRLVKYTMIEHRDDREILRGQAVLLAYIDVFVMLVALAAHGETRRFSADTFRRRSSELSTNITGVPFATLAATRSASQLVRRTQPCDSASETLSGDDVPWIP